MTRKIAFFEGLSWFKFNNLRLALGTNLKFYTTVAKGLKLKVRKFWRPNSTFVEVTGEKLVWGLFVPLPPTLNFYPTSKQKATEPHTLQNIVVKSLKKQIQSLSLFIKHLVLPTLKTISQISNIMTMRRQTP